jgi:PAS domain-containing protein
MAPSAGRNGPTVFCPAGATHEYQGTGRDITERKRAEDALRESQERITAILTTAMDAIVAVDDEQRIILFNPAAARLFRCTREEAIGSRLTASYQSASVPRMLNISAASVKLEGHRVRWAILAHLADFALMALNFR